ncbi:MAG: methyltransferase domain-containing protein [Nitrospiraceae bacterium]|nr:MAG: methyltransferase domain-containing protein [Nitrospiraceae bacterium]
MPDILEQSIELRKIWGAFRQARVLLTANNYRIFDCLLKPQSSKNISGKLRTDLRATEILLDALTGLGLLRKRNNKYQNTKPASEFLVTGSRHYQGDIIRHAETLWQNWSGLDEIVKTGKPYRKAHNHEAFILGMDNLASLKVESVIKAIGLKGVKTALDLGGGPGTYSIAMAKKGVEVTLFDRKETIAIAKRVIGKIPLNPALTKGDGSPLSRGVRGVLPTLTKTINFICGDFNHDNIGSSYDLILASQVLHSNSVKENIHLFRKCKRALNKNGRIVIQEFRISEDLTQPAPSALFSVNMLVNTDGGRCYSPDEMKGWLLKMGLKNISEKSIDDSLLISASK